MGGQRLSARPGPHAAAQRVAGGPPRREEALFDLLFLIHTGFIPVRRGHDDARVDRRETHSRDGRRPARPVGPVDGRAACRKAVRPGFRIRGRAGPAGSAGGTDPGGNDGEIPGLALGFYINLPVGILAVVLAAWILPQDKAVTQKLPFDLTGFIMISLGLVCLLYGFEQSSHHGDIRVLVFGFGAAGGVFPTRPPEKIEGAD